MLSRVADNLYWLSRYLERAEHTARVLDLTLNLLLEQRSDEALSGRIKNLLDGLFADSLPENATLYDMTQALAFDRKNTSSINFCVNQARENARQIREQISSEMWEQLNMLFHSLPEFREFGRSILVKGFTALKNRMLSMITETAEERYAHLLQNKPEIFQHAPLKTIASYLGITDTSLSRIRKELAKK